MTPSMTEAAPSTSAQNPLDAVPVVSEDVIATPANGEHGLKLERALPPNGRFFAWLERRFGFSRKQSFELDAVGAHFFRAIDGQRTLAEIEAQLRKRNHFSPSESRAAVIEFTKMLMQRGLVALRIPTIGRPLEMPERKAE